LESFVEKVDFDNGQATAVFRILQETLTNIQRHAQATNVTITLDQEPSQFFLTIQDDGKGFTKGREFDTQSLGLLGMRERANLVGGEINIESAPDKGTRIALKVPLWVVKAR
jgi:signal transduction histidine kinase